MSKTQVGIVAYKNTSTGEYELIKPILRLKTQELEEKEKELIKEIFSFFANEFINSQK